MKKALYVAGILGLAGYFVYTIYSKVGLALISSDNLLNDQGSSGVGNGYNENNYGLPNRLIVQEGVGGSDFFGGTDGITAHPMEAFQESDDL